MHDYFRYVLRSFKSHVFPGFTGIEALVNTIAVTNVSSSYILTGTDPYRVSIIGVNGDATDGVGGFGIKYRGPCRAPVFGLPDTTTAYSHVPGTAVFVADGNVGKAAKAAGVERTHLYRKLRALGIDHKKGNE